MKITKRQLKRIIREEVENLEYALSQKAAVPVLSSAETPEDVEPHEDAWAGGENIHNQVDHAAAFHKAEPTTRGLEIMSITELRKIVRNALMSEAGMIQAVPTYGWGGGGWGGNIPSPPKPNAWQRRYKRRNAPYWFKKDRKTIIDLKGQPHTIPNSDDTDDAIVMKRTDLRNQPDRYRLTKNSFGHYRIESDQYIRTFYDVDEAAEFLSQISAVVVNEK